MLLRPTLLIATSLFTLAAHSQALELHREHDSLYWIGDWRLPYPVYQFQTGDIDGDGTTDAMVGVIKRTRFHPERARRLFIFKQAGTRAAAQPSRRLRVRPLWLGSRLGGILEDFRYLAPTSGDSIARIRALESTTDSLYVVSDYRWGGFGLTFDRFIIKGVSRQTAITTFSQ